MATSDLAPPRGLLQTADARSQISASQFTLERVFAALASLKLTVVLFSLSIFLIFVGTLAQKDQDVWRVVNDTYFRVWFAHVDLQVFERFVQIFRKSVDWNLQGWFPFPGGKTIGLALLVNLAAAHAMRFKVAAEGKGLYAGLSTLALGVLITFLVVRGGMNQEVESELSPKFCDLLWQFFRGSLAALTIAGAYVLTFWNAPAKHKLIEWWCLLVVVALLGVLTVWLLANPEARLDNSGIRILWQLAKGTASAAVLLTGCILVFRKRASIVLLHGGIALIMLTELFTAVAAVESQMVIGEGETVSHSDDIRTSELAITDRSHTDHDRVTTVPRGILKSNVGESTAIDHDDLPFTIRVHRWVQNSKLRDRAAGDSNPATAGFGTQVLVDELPAATGLGKGADKADFSSAYIELTSKKSNKSLGTFLVSQNLKDQPVEVDGHKYDLALRFNRIYHPFSVALKDFRYDRYTGTNTAKNYSSDVTFKDPAHNIDRNVLISMNNPLRYGGTTLYQSSFDETERGTVLQVVKNPSWMTPYVACMLVGFGMLAHFGTILVRFLGRRAAGEDLPLPSDVRREVVSQVATKVRDKLKKAPAPSVQDLRRESVDCQIDSLGYSAPPVAWPALAKWLPAIVLLIFAGYIASKSRMPKSPPDQMQVYEFGELPLVYEGRVKPFDTLARNALQVLSSRQEVGVIDESGEITAHRPAIRWLLDTISGAKGANDERVFRVENLDVLDTLGLERRPGYWRYSLNEILKKKTAATDDPETTSELQHQANLARRTPEQELSLFQSKVLELDRKYRVYTLLVMSFQSLPISNDEKNLVESLQRAQGIIAQLNDAGAPRAVPPDSASGSWSTLMEAELEYLRSRVTNQPLNPATAAFNSMLNAYARGDVASFNKELSNYRQVLDKYESSLKSNAKQLSASGVAKSEIMSQRKADFEVFFNQFSPFYYAAVLYVFAFLLGILSWIGWTQPLRRASIWLLWFTFALHTFAIIARIYISGRPPVTNLYSTAIFIGWAVVLMSLIFESIYRLGLGNIVAAVIGFLTLVVAYNLSLDGDTFIVLQAVLDTQFWLATHVVTINLGYAATYAAGAWGIVYILCTHVFNVLNEDARKKVLRTLYGTLCFAIFFSFVGTVLGGLWADDSWGRFWGWDPKENGALMIVLWNALVLHARWGGLVKGRGLANLAVFGNIITTWSYFGVNEYGVGLHQYGPSESNTALWLLLFGMSQFTIIALGLMPSHWFQPEPRQIPAT
jgi:ABC-type transport system involved in cytochrome c biogenesis permease subunit